MQSLRQAETLSSTGHGVLSSISVCSVSSSIEADFLARNSILALMSKITKGKLRVLTAQRVYEFGDLESPEDHVAELKVVNETFWVRMLIAGDLV